MDFLNLFTVGRRHFVIVAIGVVVGLLVAGAALYKIDRSDVKPSLKARSFTEYKLEMQMMVVDPLFGVGRAGTDMTQPDLFQKTVLLSNTYAKILMSDAVRMEADRKVGPVDAEITSEAIQNAPIILLTLEGRDPEQMAKYSQALGKSLQALMEKEQDERGISKKDRISVRILSTPQPVAVQSRRWETGFLAFVGPVALAFGFAMLKDRV